MFCTCELTYCSEKRPKRPNSPRSVPPVTAAKPCRWDDWDVFYNNTLTRWNQESTKFELDMQAAGARFTRPPEMARSSSIRVLAPVLTKAIKTPIQLSGRVSRACRICRIWSA